MERVMVRLSSFLVRKPVRDDDAVDRLHHNASLILLLLFAGGTALQVSHQTATSGRVYVPCIYTYSHVTVTAEDVLLVEFMYLVFTRMAR